MKISILDAISIIFFCITFLPVASVITGTALTLIGVL